ncbi:MAG: helix-turn-helix domain-containing protein [Gemmatimonas sp.]|nr:helix-turn-helix domain-containing protein [Gemmatimonas sp.]
MTARVVNQLAAERAKRGWTQAQAAAFGGISRQSYSAIETGDAVPSTEIALRLAEGFGKRVEELFQLPESPALRVRVRAASGGGRVGQRVRLVRVGGDEVAYGVGEGERQLRPADGVVSRLFGGGEVEVRLLPERPDEAVLAVVGCDPAFGLVAEAMKRERRVEVAWSQLGSRSALEAVARSEAHVAGTHLRDPSGGGQNTRWIREILPFPCSRVTFATWEQGIMVGAGNPLAVGGVEDLTNPAVRFLNREPGSGSRALLDDRLERAGIAVEQIGGYRTGARGHMAVAEAIASGLADAGIGIQAAGVAYGLDVIPLETERYELVIPDHYLDLPAVQVLLEILARPGLRAQVEALGGYDASGMGGPA